jgi:hypothetical protein
MRGMQIWRLARRRTIQCRQGACPLAILGKKALWRRLMSVIGHKVIFVIKD